MERRYHSPYSHWLSGFVYEIAVFAGFLVVLAAMAFVVMWLAG